MPVFILVGFIWKWGTPHMKSLTPTIVTRGNVCQSFVWVCLVLLGICNEMSHISCVMCDTHDVTPTNESRLDVCHFYFIFVHFFGSSGSAMKWVMSHIMSRLLTSRVLMYSIVFLISLFNLVAQDLQWNDMPHLMSHLQTSRVATNASSVL